MREIVAHNGRFNPRECIETERSRALNITSANAILINRYRLFLRRFLFKAKRTIVSAFPTRIKTACVIKALYQAITSALERSSSVDDKDELLEDIVAAWSISFIS